MPSGTIEVSSSVFFRDEFGRFAAAVGQGVQDALDELGNAGVRSARAIVPQIATSIHAFRPSATEVAWVSAHQWAAAFERGIPRHTIAPTKDHGKLASRKRAFGPVSGPVIHPGMRPTFFLRRSYDQTKRRALRTFAKHIPG